MPKLTYNVITQEARWDCPDCGYINSFDTKERPTTLKCEKCDLSFPLDPLRYIQFEMMQEKFDDILIEILGGVEKMGVEDILKGGVEDGK